MLWNFEINHHPMAFIRKITRYRASCTGLDIRTILQCMANYELVRGFSCHRNKCKIKCVLPIQREPRPTLFFSRPINEQRCIRHHITCSSSNLVDMILCNKCNVQCTGETKSHLHSPAKGNDIFHMILFLSRKIKSPMHAPDVTSNFR